MALAFYTLLPVRVLEKWGALTVTGLAMLFGGVAASAAVRPREMPVQLPAEALAALAAIVLVGTLGAYMLYLQGIADAGPVKASLLCSIEPVSAMVISLLWLHVPVTPWDALGLRGHRVHGAAGDGAREAAAGGQEGGAALAGAKAEDPPLFAGRASELGYYADRPATREDFAEVSRLLAAGRDSMAALGIDEGPKKYPSSRRLMHSIKNGTCHVVEDAHGRPLAVFAVSFSPDKNYARGIKGAWLTDTLACPQPYAELHWVAVDRLRAPARGGRVRARPRVRDRARRRALLPARRRVRDNVPMRRLLEKRGFAHCGTVEVRDVFGRQKRRAPTSGPAVTGLRAARGAGCGVALGCGKRGATRMRDGRCGGRATPAAPGKAVRRGRRCVGQVACDARGARIGRFAGCLDEGDWTRWISARLARRT